MRKTFTFEGKAIITFKPNRLGVVVKTNEVEIFLKDGWVDVRHKDDKLTTIPREEISKIEWVPDG